MKVSAPLAAAKPSTAAGPLAAARLSTAALLAAGVCCGCVDEAPTFAPRGQRPPFVIAGQVEPPLGAVYEGPLPIEVNVPFRSEDVNKRLIARLYQDLVPGSASAPHTQEQEVAAGIYEELRSVSMRWDSEMQGCHSLTLILTYFDNFVGSGPLDDTLAARLVWWVNMGDVDGNVTMSSCPGAQ